MWMYSDSGGRASGVVMGETASENQVPGRRCASSGRGWWPLPAGTRGNADLLVGFGLVGVRPMLFCQQGGTQRLHGSAAVADARLGVSAQLGRTALRLGGPEQRVVTKTLGAARLAQDSALPGALANDGGGVRVVAHEHQYALKACVALVVVGVL